MNIKLLFVWSLSWIVVGCAAPGPECEPYTGPLVPCQGNPAAPLVTINTNTLVVAPRCVNADPGATIDFRLVPPPNNVLGDAEIFPKDPEDTWLAGMNASDKDRISIPVPEDIEVGERYYGFKTSEKCLDPRVNVN